MRVTHSTEDEFVELYDSFYRPVFRYALVARGPDEAEDIVSITSQKAYLAWSGRGERPRSPLAWLLTIARRTVIDAARRTTLAPAARLATGGSSDDALLRARETWLWFESVTRGLPETTRQILYLRFAADLSAEEIGVVVSMSASGVRSALSRAVSAIRLAEEDPR